MVWECCFCSQLEGREANDLIAHLLSNEPYVRRVMLESPSFAVIPSLGPLVVGHSLLCPKPHLRSFAHVSDDKLAEFEQIKAVLRGVLGEIYEAEVHIFEHGMAATGERILCTVEHAHMHFLPLPQTFKADGAGNHEWTVFDGSLAELRRITGGREYILYETPDGLSRLLTEGATPFESQYMRKVIAEGLGRAIHWNWREAPNPRAAHETWRRCVRS